MPQWLRARLNRLRRRLWHALLFRLLFGESGHDGAALPLVALLMLFGPSLFAQLFGEPWREAGELARALAPYIGLHFVASPLAVVTLAWGAQAWALKLALVGQVLFIGALAIGLQLGGLRGAAWAVSLAMLPYFGWYFFALANWKQVPHAAVA